MAYQRMDEHNVRETTGLPVLLYAVDGSGMIRKLRLNLLNGHNLLDVVLVLLRESGFSMLTFTD
ncbi:hypothetical protein M513_07099 [Trichuris suis]|uniref:Uncharacterized protein n=1 Tax=Trichuris suis TaxID=68888 RepID=A0A085M421_9BILA|nr:hypothetical protein M513_07099 [Trichuris suis]